MNRILVILLIALMAGQAPTIYFEEDFADVTDWVLFSGEGTIAPGGLIQTNNTVAFARRFTAFEVWRDMIDVGVDSCNGTWILYFIGAEDGNLYTVMQEEIAGVFLGQVMDVLTINGIVIYVEGAVDFQLIRIYEGGGVMPGGIFDWAEGALLEFVKANPWTAPVALSGLVLAILGLLVIGWIFRKPKRR